MRSFAPIGILLLAIISYCHGQGLDTTVGATPENLAAVSQSVTNLAQKISLAIANPKSKTEIFSPVSIAGALSLLLLGSGGNTREELMNVMGFQNPRIPFTDIHKSFGRLFQDLVSNDPAQNVTIPWRVNDKCNNYDYEDDNYAPPNPAGQKPGKVDTDSHFISVANGVFVDNSLPLNPRYANLTKELYGGEIAPMALYSDPVRSSNFINSWVQQATRNKIQQIVSPEQVSNAPMVLASALYFKAKWETMFMDHDTRIRQFFLYGQNSAPVDVESMATNGCFPFYEDKQFDAKIVGLPYQQGKSTMYIIMPNQSDRQKIRTLQERTPLPYWDGIIDQMALKTGTIVLPKMKIENTLGLKDVLASLGLRDVFIPERSNLSAITKDDPILYDMNRRPAASPPTPQPFPVYQPSTTPPNNNPSTSWAPQIPNQEKYVMPLNVSECKITNNCLYEADKCVCDPNQQIDETIVCNRKPLTVRYSCAEERILLSIKFSYILHLCYMEAYVKNVQCTRSCQTFRNECFCCRYAPSTVSNQGTLTGDQPTRRPQIQTGVQPVPQQDSFNQPTEPALSPVDIGNRHQTAQQPQIQSGSQPVPQQGTFSRPTESGLSSVDIGNRFNSYEPTSSITPLVGHCRKATLCTSLGNCHYITQCTLVNNPKRNKRQSVNSQPAKLFAGDVLHKVSLDINEQGTEGGAVTAVIVDRISPSFSLRVNGPFLIYLRNDVTKLPLFYGAVFDPRP